jgi:hypothetical protein
MIRGDEQCEAGYTGNQLRSLRRKIRALDSVTSATMNTMPTLKL